MLAETIQHTNHVCSLPTGSTIRSSPGEAMHTPLIIMPEMAIAVICPESGKSLKHQELIIILQYKSIKCGQPQIKFAGFTKPILSDLFANQACHQDAKQHMVHLY
jgi:hypothetical protein